MERIRAGSVELNWDPKTRFGNIGYHSGPNPQGQDGRELVEAMTRWLGAEPRPFGLFGDCAKMAGGDPEYRAIWARFYQEHREIAYIALFNMAPAFRVATEMFCLGTGVRMKVFSTEEESRSWLRQAGLSA